MNQMRLLFDALESWKCQNEFQPYVEWVIVIVLINALKYVPLPTQKIKRSEFNALYRSRQL
jgi:hypothetical protein